MKASFIPKTLPLNSHSPSVMVKLYLVNYLSIYFSSNIIWSTHIDTVFTKCLNMSFLFAGSVLWTSTSLFCVESCQPVLFPDHFSRTAQQRLNFYHLPVVLLTHNPLTHVNIFLSLLSMTRYILFTLGLQMICLLPTLDLLLNSFDVELLFIETPSSLAYPIIL